MQQHEIQKVCAKFWAGIFIVIMIAGIAIGIVGRTFIKTPPYMNLIETNNTEILTTVQQLSDKVDVIDSQVAEIQKTLEK